MATLRTLQPLGTGVLRYGLVFLLLFWGGLKFAAFEAAAIQPLLAHSPFLAWMLVVFDGTGGRPRPSSASSRSSSPSGSWRVASARLRSGQSRRERHVPGHAECLELAMLAGEPFVLQARSRGPESHDQILAICRTAGFSPRVVQEGSNIDVLSFVASGAGGAIVPTSLRVIRRAGIVFRPLRERPVTQLNMVWRKNARSPVLREFLDEVRRVGARGIRPRAKPTTGTRGAAL